MSSLVEATEFEKVLTKTVAPSKIREFLVDNDYLSDVIFTLANGEELRAHKMFLITSGPIFHKLFSDHKEDVIGINLDWVTKPTLLNICRFIYSDILNINGTNMMEIWSVALKLEMKYLVEKTIDFICKTLNDKSVFQVLQTNLKHNDFRLNMKCFEYIKKNHKKCLETEEFLLLPLELLKIMLQTCKLPDKLAKEAVLKWENNNSHEDIEELLMSLSLNEESEATEEKSNDSDSDESSVSHPSPPDEANNSAKKKKNRGRNDRSRGRNDKKAEAGAGSRSQNSRGRSHGAGQNAGNQRPGNNNMQHQMPRNFGPGFNNGQSFDHGPNPLIPQPFLNQQFPNRSYHKPKEQPKPMKHFILDGPMVRKPFKFANLEIGVINKNIIIQEILFNHDLSSTDVGFEFW